MDLNTDWFGVRDRVIAVLEARCRATGRAPSPDWAFEPVLTELEIVEVEAQYGAALPEEYRSFLAQVGAGGPGPGLELIPLRRVSGEWRWITPWPADLSGPFVESEDWVEQQLATLRSAGAEPTVRDAEEDYLADYQALLGEDAGMLAWCGQRVRGALEISDNGCGAASWLVVVGPHRGEMRDRDCAFNPPFEPYLDALGSRRTFRSWYLAWLERCEVTYAV